MRPDSRHRRESGGLLAFVSRQRISLAVLIVAALTLGTAMTMVTRGLSHADAIAAASDSPGPGGGGAATPTGSTPTTAPNDDGVAWQPSDIEQVGQSTDNGGCMVEMPGANFTASSTDVDTTIVNALDQEGGKNINQDGINSYSFTIPQPEPGSSSLVGVDASVDCGLLGSSSTSTPTATNTVYRGGFDPRTQTVAMRGDTVVLIQHGGVVAVYNAGMHSAIPKWLKGAIGALAGAVVFTAVSVVTVATMVALGAATGPGGVLASPALAALAGCIGGAVSTAVTIAIATSGGVASDVAAAVAGCVTGGIIGSLPANQVGTWLGNTFRGVLGTDAAPVVGTALDQAATSSGASLSPYGQAMQDALSGLGGV